MLKIKTSESFFVMTLINSRIVCMEHLCKMSWSCRTPSSKRIWIILLPLSCKTHVRWLCLFVMGCWWGDDKERKVFLHIYKDQTISKSPIPDLAKPYGEEKKIIKKNHIIIHQIIILWGKVTKITKGINVPIINKIAALTNVLPSKISTQD